MYPAPAPASGPPDIAARSAAWTCFTLPFAKSCVSRISSGIPRKRCAPSGPPKTSDSRPSGAVATRLPVRWTTRVAWMFSPMIVNLRPSARIMPVVPPSRGRRPRRRASPFTFACSAAIRFPIWSRPRNAFAQALVRRSALSVRTGGRSSIVDSSPHGRRRSYARTQMQSLPGTSHSPSWVPPHGPLRWFFAHWLSGQRYAMSGSEQSPQSRQSYSGTFTACSRTWRGLPRWKRSASAWTRAARSNPGEPGSKTAVWTIRLSV